MESADRGGRRADGHVLSMPLRGAGGRVAGLLALSSGTGNAFGEAALSALRLVESPAAFVVDIARPAGSRSR